MEVASFVAAMDENERKECLKILVKTNLRLFGDVLVEEQKAEEEKLSKNLGILGQIDA